MRRLILAAAACAGLVAATPVLADTLSEVTSHGIMLTIGDMDIPIDYTPDHKLSGMGGQLTGTWRIDGDKLCTTSNFDPNESCFAYPKDKKSGDKFDVDTGQGMVQIRIR